MSLQWLSAAAFLYTEIGIGVLLCIPIISNARWQRIFTSRLLGLVKQYGNFLFMSFVLLLFVLFADSLFSTYRFSKIDTKTIDLHNNPQAEIQAHMKLFRAQRNLYITGFSLFMLVIIRRLVMLISKQATLEASHEAVIKQAKGASEQCKKLMDENDTLRKDKRVQATSDTDMEEIKEELEKKIDELKEELKMVNAKSEKTEKFFEAMKSQSEGLHREYDRLLEEHNKLEKQLSIAGGGDDCHAESKKDS